MSAFGEGKRSPSPLSGRAGERGIALILVLWVLALLSVLAVGFASNARTELLIVRNQIESARARAVAEAGAAQDRGRRLFVEATVLGSLL